MARRRTCHGCGQEFTPPLFALTRDARRNCSTCRRGFLITPAEQRQGAWTTLKIGPWTDTTTATRPTVMGARRLPQAEIEKRAAALGRANFPTPAEREDGRRLWVAGARKTAYETVFAAALADQDDDTDGDPEPEGGGSWGDVDLAEVVDT